MGDPAPRPRQQEIHPIEKPCGMLRSAASPGSRGVRPARERCEWPPHTTASGRPPFSPHIAWARRPDSSPKNERAPNGRPRSFRDRRGRVYLILPSRNSTCFLATGSYFFFTSFSVCVREFFLVT